MFLQNQNIFFKKKRIYPNKSFRFLFLKSFYNSNLPNILKFIKHLKTFFDSLTLKKFLKKCKKS